MDVRWKNHLRTHGSEFLFNMKYIMEYYTSLHDSIGKNDTS